MCIFRNFAGSLFRPAANLRASFTFVLLVTLFFSTSSVPEVFGQRSGRQLERIISPKGKTKRVSAPAVLFASPVQTILTSTWTPASPDPSGIAYDIVNDRLIVVDSEVDETTGAGYNGVNIWSSTRLGVEMPSGTTLAWGGMLTEEPTGAGYDPATGTLFISTDDDDRVYVVNRGADGLFGTADDLVRSILTEFLFGLTDNEDPAFDAATGDLFVLDGAGTDVFRIDPVNGIFGDGDDTATSWDVGNGVSDAEGLAIHPARDTVLVGERNGDRILEFQRDGTLVDTIDMSGVTGLDNISGLTVAPASDNSSPWHLWIVDRKVDNDSVPTENDGTIYEVSVPWGVNLAPVVDLVTIDNAAPGTNDTLTANVLSHDEDGDVITLSYQWYKNDVALAGETGSTLDLSQAGNGDKGDRITVEVDAFDGTSTSTARTSQAVKVVNTLPSLSYPDRENSEGEPIVTSVAVTDPDGDTLTYAATGLPPGLTLDPSTGAITGSVAIDAADNSPYNTIITVSDGDTTPMPITLVQAVTPNTVLNTSVTTSFASQPVEGNLLVALGRVGSGRFPVMGDLSWRFVILSNETPRAVAYYKIAGPSEPTDVTMTAADGTATQVGLALFEYSGVDMYEFDALESWFSRGQIPDTNSATAGPVVTSQTGSLLLGGLHTAGNRVVLDTWTNDFDRVSSLIEGTTSRSAFTHRLADGPGSFETSNSWGGSDTDAATTLMSFRPKPLDAGETQDGFQWTISELEPSAAPVSLSGRVVDVGGRPVKGAILTAQDQEGNWWSATTNTFGYYRLEGLSAGDSFVVNVYSRRYSFAPVLVTPEADLEGLNFVAAP